MANILALGRLEGCCALVDVVVVIDIEYQGLVRNCGCDNLVAAVIEIGLEILCLSPIAGLRHCDAKMRQRIQAVGAESPPNEHTSDGELGGRCFAVGQSPNNVGGDERLDLGIRVDLFQPNK